MGVDEHEGNGLTIKGVKQWALQRPRGHHSHGTYVVTNDGWIVDTARNISGGRLAHVGPQCHLRAPLQS